MKSNLKKYTIILLLLIILSLIITNSKEVMNSSIMAIEIWKKNIFPALFPLFVIADLLINYDFINLLGNLFYKPLNKLFGFTKEEIFIFFISMISGFPSSSKYTSLLYNNHLISVNDANRILSCSHFSNPLFIFGTIYSLINNKKICLFIFISHYLGNFIIALFTRKKTSDASNFQMHLKRQSFSDCLTNSISNNTTTLLFILGSITLFLILTTIINTLFSFNSTLSTLLCGICEMTQGIKAVSMSNLSIELSSIFITLFISFGGVSVHLQTLGMIANTPLSYKKFFLSRIMHSILSILIVTLLIKYFY